MSRFLSGVPCIELVRRKVVKYYDGPQVEPTRNMEDRPGWSGRFDFIMACVGYAVGLGNVWRFPYLRHSDYVCVECLGAFLIPYMLISLTSGVPLFFLEISVGQFTGQGCVTCWKLCPMFKGIGYGIVVLCTWLNVYYIVVLAWSIYYFAMSWNFERLPWTHCENPWNTPSCVASSGNLSNQSLAALQNGSKDSAEEFWFHKGSFVNHILKLSDNVETMGSLNWNMVGALATAWILNYFIIWKGVKVSGKIVYVTALFPYVMLIVLLIRGVTLPGALMGIEFYLRPNFTKLLEAGVWLDAGTQIFFSYAVSTGALIAMGSYNRFTNDCYKDTWIICVVNSCTSFLSGFCIFSVLGYMAFDQGKNVSQGITHKLGAVCETSGPGLAFVAYPKALSMMPIAPLWSILFFIMLMMLGIDSQFVGLEGLFTALLDIYPYFRHGHRPEIVMGVACFISFLFGLLMCTEGGMYVFQLFDYYSASGFVLLWFCFFECVALAWTYGAQRFYRDISNMIGYRISPWMLICWAILAPVTSLIIFVVSLVEHEPIMLDKYQYPVWADALGWCMALSSMVAIPIYAIVALLRAQGSTFAEAIKGSPINYVTFDRKLASLVRAREEISDGRAMATEREAHRSHSPAIRNFLPGSYEPSEFPGKRHFHFRNGKTV